MGKVILIDSRKTGDWSLDLLFAGLVQNLGAENVIDFPPQEKHRMGRPKLVGEHEKDWGAERMSLSYVPEFASIRRWSTGEIQEELRRGRIDYIFLDERKESYELYMSLRANFFEVPVVLVSGHDKFWNVSPDWVRKNYYPRRMKAMFLDNWRDEYNLLPNAHVYSWSINFDHLWNPADRNQKKVYDVSFMGYNSHPDRARFIDHLLSSKLLSAVKFNLVMERRPDSFGMFVNKAEYFRTMAQSRICLNLKGAAENGKTLRFYEIPYVGSLMLSDRSSFLQNQAAPFLEGVHYAAFGDEHELESQIYNLLHAPGVMDTMAKHGHEWAMQEHTSKARVRQMLEKLNGQV